MAEFDVMFDGAVYCKASFGGVTRYLAGLTEALRAEGLRVGLFLPGAPKGAGPHLPKGVPVVMAPHSAGWWVTEDPHRLSASPASSTVLIVHDVMAFTAGLQIPQECILTADFEVFSEACHRADAVVAVSRCTRTALLRMVTSVDPHRVHVVGHGLVDAFQTADPVSGGGDFVFHVGGRDGYKRFDLLLGAFASSGLPGDLVNAGGRRNLTEGEGALVDYLGLTGRVRTLGYVDDSDLVALYRRARVVVVASDCEGYGLPMREAVALGRPLVAPQLPITSEVVGDAAHNFLPGDLGSLASALRAQWDSPHPVSQADLIAARAGWQSPARTMADILRGARVTTA
jgi:glycosyltransferase involved in cell wall biosynthesis